MGQRLNIGVVLEGRPSGAERSAIAECLLARVRPWIGVPLKAAVNYVTVPDFREIEWSGEVGDLPELLAPDVLLHVYSDAGGAGSGTLTLEQGPAALGLTVSVRLAALQPVDLEVLEGVMVDMFSCIPATRRAALFAGPELEIGTDAGTFEEMVRRSFADTSLVTFVIGPDELLLPRNPGFAVGQARAGYVAMRQRYAKQRLESGM